MGAEDPGVVNGKGLTAAASDVVETVGGRWWGMTDSSSLGLSLATRRRS